MATISFSDIPWSLMAASPDMMANRPGVGAPLPYTWRSSLAISAYDPPLDQLPEGLCDQRITYLKVTCSITGYQPSDQEIADGMVRFPRSPQVELERALTEYWACYGALLNVAVFPEGETTTDLSGYPHVVAVEPTSRELIQPSTETGEILSKSSSSVSTDRTFGHTVKNESGWELQGKAQYGAAAARAGAVEASLTYRNMSTDERNATSKDSGASGAETDVRRADQTTIEQLYTLLTAYHVGTNRAVFFVLPRPHIEEPTDRRTFVRGLRELEGLQEFFLIVSRPRGMLGLCVRATLDTGHFPENVNRAAPPPPDDAPASELFRVPCTANSSYTGGERKILEEDPRYLFRVEPGRVIDFNSALQRLDPPSRIIREGISLVSNDDNTIAQRPGMVQGFDMRAMSVSEVQAYGTIIGSNDGSTPATVLDRTFRIYTKAAGAPSAPADGPITTPMLVTARELSVCMISGDTCIQVAPSPAVVVPSSSIVAEQRLAEASPDGSRIVRGPREVTRVIATYLRAARSKLQSSTVAPLSYVDTRHVQERLLALVPPARLRAPLGELLDLGADGLAALRKVTIRALFAADPDTMATELGCTRQVVNELRTKALAKLLATCVMPA